MTPQEQYEMLVESLQLLAAPAQEQLSALPDFVNITDEIVSTFGDAYLLVPQLIRAGLVKDRAAEALKQLEDLLSTLPADDSLAAPASLKEHEYWTKARTVAGSALAALGERQTAPILKHSTYVR